jgi:glycosyltransferase involved in cell wall biosynthesis
MLKISVVTPSYNQAVFLERTIRSVIDQNYPNLEHIVIDGGSNDGSVEIIKKYADRFAYWVSEKDKGQTDALNKGFVRCTGDILCWLNSDDTFLPGALNRVAAAAEQNPDSNFFLGDIHYIDAQDRLLGIKRYSPIHRANVLLEGMVFSQPATFWRKSLMDRVGLLDASIKFSMDYDLFCRMAPFANYKYIDAYLATYRLHETSKTCTIANVGRAEAKVQMQKYGDPVYPKWKQRLLIPALKAERVLYHLSRFRLGYLARQTWLRLPPRSPDLSPPLQE